jgi:hypothetical protein
VPVRVPWSSVSFLLYAGGLTILFSSVSLLQTLGGDYHAAAFAGWSFLVLACLATSAFGLRRAGNPVAAGLFATSAVVAFVVFLGALEHWIGWLADSPSLFGGFHVSILIPALAGLAASLVALKLFRFPLLVLLAAIAGWYFVTDLISNGGDWSAVVTILVGLVLLALAAGTNPVYGFWLHVTAGLAIGGGIFWLWHSSNFDWVLVTIASLLYIWFGDRMQRSSWVVIGALGLLLASTHWIDRWANLTEPLALYFLGGLGYPQDGGHAWARPVGYAALGIVYMLLAFLLERRRRVVQAPAGA